MIETVVGLVRLKKVWSIFNFLDRELKHNHSFWKQDDFFLNVGPLTVCTALYIFFVYYITSGKRNERQKTNWNKNFVGILLTANNTHFLNFLQHRTLYLLPYANSIKPKQHTHIMCRLFRCLLTSSVYISLEHIHIFFNLNISLCLECIRIMDNLIRNLNTLNFTWFLQDCEEKGFKCH